MPADWERTTGRAFAWKVLQLGGVKTAFFVRTLVLARLLGPDDFGLFAVSLISIELLTRITDFGLVPALVQSRSIDSRDQEAAWTVNLLRACAISAVVFAASPLLVDLLGEPRALWPLRALCLRPLLFDLASIRLAEQARRLDFRGPVTVRLVDALVNTVVAIALARAHGAWALVAGSLAGTLAHAATSYGVAPWRPRLRLDRERVRRLVDFGRWIFWISVTSVIVDALLKIVITRRLGVEALGLYFLAAKLAFLPVELAEETIGAVSFPLYARLQDSRERLQAAVRSLLLGSTLILAPAVALIVALVPGFVTHVLGAKWDGTVPLIRALAVAGFLGLLGEVVVPALKGLGHVQAVFLMEVAQSGVLLVAAWWLGGVLGVLGVALASWPSRLASQVLGVVSLQRVAPGLLRGSALPCLIVVVASAASGLVAAFVGVRVPGLLGLAAGGLAGIASVTGLLWAAERRLGLGLAPALGALHPTLARWLPAARDTR
jgi:O-antigen/teichoic acid export membrane protein